jgi:hypothetical protein
VQGAYTAALAASGGTTPYRWSISLGSLPAGISLNSSTGAISGTPTQSGTFSFTAQVTDSASKTAQQALSIQLAAVGQLSITTTSLPQGTTSAAYSATLLANNGTTPYSWTISSGSLPAGLSLNASTGVISGTPSQSGSFSFTVKVTDSANNTAQQLLSIVISLPLSVTSTSLPQGTTSVAYSATLQATGGTTPYSWMISSGSLPGGLSLNSSTGAISGTPTQPGTFSFTAQATDAASRTAQQSLTILVATAVSINTTSLPLGMAGVAYSATLQATGGTTPYSWSVSSGSLPAGLSLNASSGVVSGTPTQSGTFSFTAQATDAASRTAQQSLSILVSAALSITTTSLPQGTANVAYSTTLQATGGTTPYSWMISSGSLPGGLSLNSSTGAISGTPTQSGTFSFTAHVTDSASRVTQQLLSMQVLTTLTITSSLQQGTVGVAYSATLQASGGTTPYSWTISLGSLPAGLLLNSATGAITGTPTQSGTFSFTAQVMDSANNTAQKLLTVLISAALSITTTSLPQGGTGVAYSTTLQAAGGLPGYSWSIASGSLPVGLSLLASTGQISGVPTTIGTSNFAVQASDSSSPPQTATQNLTVAIAAPTVDPYGGRTDIPCTTNAGKWHTEKINSRWWICTPAGHAFWKQGLYVTGIAPNLNINAKYGSTVNFVNAQLSRFQAWGFNTIDIDGYEGLWPTASPTPSILTPFISSAKPGLDAMNGRALNALDVGGLNYAVKNIWATMPPGFYVYDPWLPAQPDPSDPGIATVAGYIFTHDTGWLRTSGSLYANYLMGVQLDDADNMWAFSQDLCTPGLPVQHLGWVSLATSPIQNAGTLLPYGTTFQQFLYYDNTHVSKAGLEAFLKNRYGNSISALNTAWGSNYTQWDSTGTTVTGETVATGDGRTTAYTHTLANSKPSRYSIGITINGTLVAGDLAHDNGNGGADPTNTTDGRIWGPYLSGKITYGTGALSVTFSTTFNPQAGNRNIQKISIANNVVTVVTVAQHGLWTGAKVNISGTTNYNGTALGPITVVDSITFTYPKTASLATETAGTYALNAAPGASDTIKVNYIYNGWEIGTGLMDEANNHSWSNSDPYACNMGALPAQMRTDLNDYLYQVAYTYYSGLATQIHTYLPKAMYAGHDAVSNGVPKAPILKAAAQTLDVLATAYGNQFTQSQLDTLYAGYGDRPLYDSFYSSANLDSPNATVPDAFPRYLTQEARGQAYYSRVQSALSATYSATGSHPYVGTGVWSYLDMNDGNGYRFGLVSQNDNAYDGHEAAPGTKTCSPPLQTYMCVAETSFTLPTWQANSSVPYGNQVVHVVFSINGTYYIFESTTGGTTGSTQPNWASNCPALGNICNDNGVIWQNMGVWTKSANPSYYGDVVTAMSQGNGLWLSVAP